MDNARRVIQPRSYTLGILVALSLALLQGQSCARGNTELTNLELEVDGGPNLIVGFDTLNRNYDVSTSGSTVTVRAQTVYAINDISWQWLVGTTTIGSGSIGTGSGEVTIPIPIPDGESVLRIVVVSNEVGATASGYYAINITNQPPPCASLPDGTACDFASVDDGVCRAGVCVDGFWGTPVLLETDDTDAGGSLAAYYDGPQVAVDPSGNATAVWSQHDGTAYSIYANHYPAGGPWGTAVLIEVGNAGDAVDPKVTVDPSGNVTAVWKQWDGSRFNIYANHYPAGGPWGSPLLLETDDTGNTVTPQVAADAAGNLTAVWSQWDGAVYDVFANQAPAGGPWGTPVLLETDDGGNALHPQVAVDPAGNVTVVWWQEPDGLRSDIYANRYPVGGPWGTAVLLETDDTGDAFHARLAVDSNGNVTVVWAQFEGTRTNIHANRYPVGGPWGSPVLIETGDGDARSPQVAVDPNGNVTAIWRQLGVGAWNLHANHYPAGGPWGTPELLETSDAGSVEENPQVAVDSNGDVTVVWAQSDGSVYSIYANRYPAGGPGGQPGLLETDNTGDALDPQVAVDSNGNATVVWMQFDGTADSVYAIRSMNEAPVVPLTVAIADNLPGGVHIFPFNLNVVPTSPITANQPFTADLSGSVELPEYYLDFFQVAFAGGVPELAIVDLKATVQTRGGGATGADVALGWDDTGLPYECGFSGGACDPQNDQVGIPGIRPNSDCVPTGDFNPCNRYVDLPTSADCAAGGVCDGLGKLATQCANNGFCVTGNMLLPLQPVLGASYVAGDGVSPGQTEALFGWADNPPPATAVGVPAMDADGTWNMLEEAIYEGAVGELGIRMTVLNNLIWAFEGVMGTDSAGPAGVGVPDDASPMPSSSLVSFPVMQP